MGMGTFLLQYSAPPNPPIVWDAKGCRKIMHPQKDQRRGYTIYGDALRATPAARDVMLISLCRKFSNFSKTARLLTVFPTFSLTVGFPTF